MITKHFHHALILILLLFTTSLAQTPIVPPLTDEQRKGQQELKGKALSLLEDVIKDSESFKSAENRIRVRATAANILWPHDEARARILFKEAMASLADLLNNQETGDAPPDNPRMYEGPRSLRRELLQMLGQRDARLAREFMRATRPPSSQPNSRRDGLPDQQIEINLAVQIAETDPKQALEIAEESLARGLSYELPQLLSALREKDPEGAAKLASEMMAKIRTEKLESSHVARQVAVTLLREAAQTPDDEGKNAKSTTLLLDQSTLRELADMLLREALRPASTSPELLGSLQEMLPIIEKYASPSRLAQLRRAMEPQKGATTRGADDNSVDVANNNTVDVTDLSNAEMSKYGTMVEKGTIDELLEAAPKAPEGMREMLYQRAVGKMMEEGDTERARQHIKERIKDPEQRKQMLAQLDEMAAIKAAEQGKIEQTRKHLATLRTNEERMMVLAQLATGAAAKGDKKVALQLLDEARGMIGGRAKNFTQLGAQLSVARAYAHLDASRSLAILEPVVDQLNELLAAAVVLGGFITEEFVRDDEITMEPLTMISNELIGSVSTDINALARADFDRTKALADRFLRDEIRIIARLLLAQSILSPQTVIPKRVSVISGSSSTMSINTEP
ncbi:MAG: hypothetical protein H0U54_03020 [Acidobacteria bacterium]|nr:hypothetical protein [Acidobacteriota bacterium]